MNIPQSAMEDHEKQKWTYTWCSLVNNESKKWPSLLQEFGDKGWEAVGLTPFGSHGHIDGSIMFFKKRK